MKVKELIEKLQSINLDLEVVVGECQKHEDNIPFQSIIGIENYDTDDETVCSISVSASPGTITKQQAAKFAEHIEGLPHNKRCTVWPPAGSGSGWGLYIRPTMELLDDYLHIK